jgi:hypothetical protein
MVDIEQLKTKYLNLEFDSTALTVDVERSLTVARTCGETQPEFTDPDHPDFQFPAHQRNVLQRHNQPGRLRVRGRPGALQPRSSPA